MGSDLFEISFNGIKLVVLFLAVVSSVPLLVWLERRGSAFIQNRFGPNRVGPLGLLQLMADAIKFLFKEEFYPKKSVAAIYYAAPVVALLPGVLAFAAIPLSAPLLLQPFVFMGQEWGPYSLSLQGYNLHIAIVYILGISSLGAYGILMAGWGSSNKYSLLGALRASAQIISYELALSLSLVGALLIYETFDLNEMLLAQKGPLTFQFLNYSMVLHWLPAWGIFYQPLGALLFFAAAFAESNRLPFDLAESESELVAGFHTEYGGFKMLLFFMGEYAHMMVASAIMVTLYFGGYAIPGLTGEQLRAFFTEQGLSFNASSILMSLIFLMSFLLKTGFFLWIFIWVRWTLPRFRYDQLMDLGWKTMLPWALVNTLLTAFFVYMG